MYTIHDLQALKDGDGATLKNGKPVQYKTGYQVAVSGIETENEEKAMQAIETYNGNCGIWFSDGIYYIDKSKRIKTKKEALETGRLFNQISILNWSNMTLIYC